jgi:S-adenosylmethionine:tRNA-ribosyltransferase-isomerase (queuine synthetase)
MQVSDFSFHLPSELIAQAAGGGENREPVMVVSRRSDAPALAHTFAHLPEFLRDGRSCSW